MIIPAKYKPELCASRDSTRYILADCYLRGHDLIATDGRRIIRIPVQLEDGDVDGFIPVDVLKECRGIVNRKRRKHSPTDIQIECHEDVLRFNSRFGVIESKRPKHGNYPGTSGVISDKPKKGPATIAININLLYGVAKALGSETVCLSFEPDSNGEKNASISVYPTGWDKTKPHAELMPIRLS